MMGDLGQRLVNIVWVIFEWLRLLPWIEIIPQALVTFGGVFYGVKYAHKVSVRHENKITIRKLQQVAIIAIKGIAYSLKVLTEFKEDDPKADDSTYYLVLQNPANTLNTLVNMPEFVENGSPELAQELTHLNTVLQWRQIIFSQTQIPTPPIEPESKLVIASLDRAKKLLEKQIKLFEK